MVIRKKSSRSSARLPRRQRNTTRPHRLPSRTADRPRHPGEPQPSRIDPQLLAGVTSFNRRELFECHEILEAAWLTLRGPSRDFYKGLIQAAVACYHWSRGNRRGAVSLYYTSTRYLERYHPVWLGVDVRRFLNDFHRLFERIQRDHVSYDARLVPTIQLAAGVRRRA